MTLRSLESQTMEGFPQIHSVQSLSILSNYHTDTKNLNNKKGKLLQNNAFDDNKLHATET